MSQPRAVIYEVHLRKNGTNMFDNYIQPDILPTSDIPDIRSYRDVGYRFSVYGSVAFTMDIFTDI